MVLVTMLRGQTPHSLMLILMVGGEIMMLVKDYITKILRNIFTLLVLTIGTLIQVMGLYSMINTIQLLGVLQDEKVMSILIAADLVY